MTAESNYYMTYGLTVQSDLCLPELRAPDTVFGSPDIVVRTGSIESHLASADDTVDVKTVQFDSVGAFAIVDGREIVCDLDSSELRNHRHVHRIVYMKALPIALLQRGSVVMHASATVVNGSAAIFLGSPSAGKSTTAAAFYSEGYPVLADDIIGIRLDDGTPTVLPGVPQLRLDSEGVAALGIDEASVSNQLEGSETRYLNLSPLADPVPVGCFYVLVDDEPMGVEPLAGTERFFQVVKRTFHDGFLSGVDMSPTGFQQCSAVIDASPIRYLRRPRRYDVLPSLVELVADDLTTTESDSG